MFESNTLVASFFWGTVGFAFSLYGWRTKEPVPLFGGIAVIAISYFISSAWLMSLVAIALIAGIFWLKRRL